jgi:signal transduction histidine kinase
MMGEGKINIDGLDEFLDSLSLFGQRGVNSVAGIIEGTLQMSASITESKAGFAVLYDRNDISNLYYWPGSINIADNEPNQKHNEIPGILAELFIHRQPLIFNQDIPDTIKRIADPYGKIDISRLLCISVFENDKIVFVLGVNNKEEDYSVSDAKVLSLLGTVSWNKAYRLLAENNFTRQKLWLQSLYDLIQKDFDTEKELITYALEEAVRLTESEIGYLHFLHPDQKTIDLYLWSSEVLKNCTASKDRHYPIENAGLWADSARLKKPVIHNDYPNNTEKKGYPEGHSPIERHLGVPVIDKNLVVVICGVGNKKAPYTNSDAVQLQLYLQEIWKIINRIRTDIYLKESEQALKQQNEEFLSINEELNESNVKIMNFNEELKIAKEKAEESDRLKSAFLANMSHEIRTPMNAIAGFAELLRQRGLDYDTIDQYVEIINSNGQQLISIIDDIIDISRIEADEINISPARTNINKILQELTVVFRTVANNKDIDFFLFCGLEDEKAYSETDEIRLKQVFSNIISNAIKFTHKGSVTIGYTFNNNIFEFYVRDTGIGISPEHFEMIFERFRQVESGLSRKFGGTGLGLTISKVLIKLLGGKIWLTSEFDKGSTFYFTLPYIKSKQTKATEAEKDKVVVPHWPDKTILVAEDEEFNYFLIQEILSQTNVRVLRAKNGIEAVESCKKYPEINLVLMDIKMPEMNGYEATKIIKSFKPHLPIIAQTAYAMTEDRSKALSAGCDSYLSKPIQKERLLSVIRDQFSR